MNIKLKRVIEEIEKTESKIIEWQEYVKQLKQQRKQLEDLEIIKTIRSMQLSGGDMLKLLEDIQTGNISIVSDSDGEGNLNQELSDEDEQFQGNYDEYTAEFEKEREEITDEEISE